MNQDREAGDAGQAEKNDEPRPVVQAGLGLLAAMPSSRATPPWTSPHAVGRTAPIAQRTNQAPKGPTSRS